MPYLYERGLFRVGNLRHHRDLSRLRWTVDETEDFDLVEAIFGSLHTAKPDFGLADVLALFDRQPGLRDINSRFERDEGYRRSLAADSRPWAEREPI